MPIEITDELIDRVLAEGKRVSDREERRERARYRREDRLKRRREMFADVVAGQAYEEVAAKYGVHVATVRREVDLALAARAPEAPDRYIALQMARLQKALRLVDGQIDEGNLAAIPALATLCNQFDRYHGVAALLAARPRPLPALQEMAPKALESPER
jgi:hypothetical protein